MQSFSEFVIGSELKHPNIVEYKYYIKHQTDTDHNYHIIMELMEGPDMKTYLLNKKYGPPIKMEFVKKIAKQLLSAIAHLHKNKIIHQDLKPSNIMFTAD